MQNARGVHIRPADYGGIGGVRFLDNGILKEQGGYTQKMLTYFKEFGYEEGISFRGASFDVCILSLNVSQLQVATRPKRMAS